MVFNRLGMVSGSPSSLRMPPPKKTGPVEGMCKDDRDLLLVSSKTNLAMCIDQHTIPKKAAYSHKIKTLGVYKYRNHAQKTAETVKTLAKT